MAQLGSRQDRSPEVSELRAFCAAVDLGSLSRGARLLHVSQPGLSKRLRTLESVVDARLLNRSAHGVSPTPEGSRLYAQARKALVEIESIENLIGGMAQDDAAIRLAASHTMAEYALPGPLVEFEALHEHHLSVELFIANSHFVRSLVREGNADFGVAAVDPPAEQDKLLKERPFCEEEVVVAVPQKHPWASTGTIKPKDLVSTRMVMRDPAASTRQIVESVLAADGLSLAEPLAEVGSTSAAKAVALEEGAPVLLSRMAVSQDERLVPCTVRGLRFRCRFALVFASEEALSCGARALMQFLLEQSPRQAEAKRRAKAKMA